MYETQDPDCPAPAPPGLGLATLCLKESIGLAELKANQFNTTPYAKRHLAREQKGNAADVKTYEICQTVLL